ncbi:hypothetical protein [Nostoc sp. T09]|uniref:hypothetical protein n=1 Tax=Nostoc sp. T09 TaxID=1932621 RepID=UPI0015C50BDD|nr:hypothetical protein [Nostoc sp. T09]
MAAHPAMTQVAAITVIKLQNTGSGIELILQASNAQQIQINSKSDVVLGRAIWYE